MADPVHMPNISMPTRDELDPEASTPLEKCNLLPLTPPASTERRGPSGFDAEEFLDALNNDPVGAYAQRPPIKLTPGEYDRFTTALKGRRGPGPYNEDKLRFDYDPRCALLQIRMPKPIHGLFSAFLAEEINEKLKTIAKRPDGAGEFAAWIYDGRSSLVLLREAAAEGDDPRLSGAVLKRDPDLQFQHQKAVYPGLVLEISHSQDGKDLRKLAWDYIQCSNGNVKVVIGIDINYGSTSSTVSLWRPKFIQEEGELDVLDVEQEIKRQPFRSPTGESLNEGRNIRLTLDDFATDELCEGLEPAEIYVPYGRLAELLRRAEDIQKIRDQASGEGVKSKPRIKRRRRHSSSPERLSSEGRS
ncbi:hypothetical protein F4861DRAFT_497987 [Xylaria intraflava]|nr:hypothetical protein F4861DRAFT_497987 [Xylaria intraflava]